MNIEQKIAQQLLIQKAHSFSARAFIRQTVVQYVLLLAAPICLFVQISRADSVEQRFFLLFMAAFFLGLIVRDIALFFARKQEWPHTKHMIDWAAVESAAKDGGPRSRKP